ncbi:MAG: carboxylesterase family protein [Acidobacteria bacterium]|nr:carboxylesterase family protein [Acidobacteriota bacterium]
MRFPRLRNPFTLAAFAATCCLCPVSQAALPPAIATESGLVSGAAAKDAKVTAFKGLPYAAPPVGELRWRAPRPAAQWSGTKAANQYSAGCIQNLGRSRKPWTEEFMHQGGVSEDCLTLNIWTPAQSPADKRPVMVWIHGGGYVEGSNAIASYDGEQLARLGIVVVSVNYRMGVLGFLAHPELTKESDVRSSGNYGLLDQLAALRWVQKNIAAFGGDPGRVTIAGQSAGAGSVMSLTASPLAKGLFHGAIAESGAGTSRGNRPRADAEAEGIAFARAKGAETLAQLRALPVDQLTKPVAGVSFRPVVDGWFLPASVQEIYAQGKQNDVPTLTGLTADEGSSSPTYGKIPAADYSAQIAQRFGDLAATFVKLYPAVATTESGAGQIESARDQGVVATHLWAVDRARTARTKAFTYYWNHALPGADHAGYGAFHTSEVPYVFNSLALCPRPWQEQDRQIAAQMSAYWANFVRTRDPNGKGLPMWPAFSASEAKTMSLGDKPGPRAVAAPEKIAFWRDALNLPTRAAR